MASANSYMMMPRATLPAGVWDHMVEEDPSGWWFHTERFIDYALAYTPQSQDASQALVRNGRYVEALFIGVVAPDAVSVYGGQPFPAPLVSRDSAIGRVDYGGHPSVRVSFRPGASAPRGCQPGFIQRQHQTRVIDVTQTEAVLWRQVRKSYRSVIHRAEARYILDLYGGGDEDKAAWRMERAHTVHTAVAQCETRPMATWVLQGEWLRDGYALLALAQDGLDPRAFAYVVRWKDWAYYFSGASRDPNLQHALLWQVIRTLRTDGGTHYLELGHDWQQNATEKDRHINFFLDGMGGTNWPVDFVEAEAPCVASP